MPPPSVEVLPLAELSRIPPLFSQPASALKTIEFFTAQIRNPHTRRAYWNAAVRFARWCEQTALSLERVQPIHAAAYIEQMTRTHSRPTVKQHLASLRALFGWLVVGRVLPSNPATSVRGPRYSVSKGKTPVLTAAEVAVLLSSIDASSPKGLRDRTLIALMGYTFARVGAAVTIRVRDYFVQGRRSWVRLQEKGGKVNDIPCHHLLDEMLDQYLRLSGLAAEPEAPLFPAMRNGRLTRRFLNSSDVLAMIRRRALQAGIRTPVTCHSFRATGITTYLSNGGRLEVAQAMAGHASPRTTSLYDRRSDQVSVEEIERIAYRS